MELSGFQQDEICELISSLPEIKDVEDPVIEGDFDVQRALDDINESETQRGDVWQLGSHRLVCGDATFTEDKPY